jgi:heterodisulfide reductase subunit B
MMRYGYYPGCSLGGLARPYDISTKAIAGPLGIELEEIEDWNCCGATEYMSISKNAAYALIARNLALAAKEGMDQILAPCSACYLNLKKTDRYMAKYPELNEQTNIALGEGGLKYKPGTLQVRHLIDAVVNDVGYDALAEKVTNPLKGLRVAPYYGCLIVRPDYDGDTLGNVEYPTFMDKLMTCLGAEVVDFPLKSHCCGGHMTQISADTAFELIHRILHNAFEYKADLIVALCPICQLNLDAYQPQVNSHFGTNYQLPVLFFTQMIGLALGIEPKELAIGQEFVSSSEVLKKIGRAVEVEPEKKAPRKRDDQSIPMPRMRGEG